MHKKPWVLGLALLVVACAEAAAEDGGGGQRGAASEDGGGGDTNVGEIDRYEDALVEAAQGIEAWRSVKHGDR